tara:strand:+ start:190 stop:471 length:282 start_codon:yes stop_codon:yes gene_type:complete
MYIDKAINRLATEQDATLHYSYVGFINSEADFKKINIEDDKSFNFTWSDVQAKATEIEQEVQTKKDNKLSAYRKMDMTDDEIKAIDPTLLSED